jgi:hypothetical protein
MLKGEFEELTARSLQSDARIYGSDLWSSWHALADGQDPSAKEFLVERLSDARIAWREVGVSLLGFHYKLDDQILNKIRELLLHDSDSGVRISAASVLGSQGKFPEETLITALDSDPGEDVRRCAFDAHLDLAEIPWMDRRREELRIKSNEIIPDLNQIKRVLLEHNKEAEIALLAEK